MVHKGAGWLHNPAAWGVRNTSERGTKAEVALKWAGWLHNPCRLGGPQRFRAGDKMSSGSQKWKKLILLVSFLLSKKVFSFSTK